MTINVYPVKVEAYDEMGNKVLSVETFDDMTAVLKIETIVSNELDELFDAIIKAVSYLDLKDAKTDGD